MRVLFLTTFLKETLLDIFCYLIQKNLITVEQEQNHLEQRKFQLQLRI